MTFSEKFPEFGQKESKQYSKSTGNVRRIFFEKFVSFIFSDFQQKTFRLLAGKVQQGHHS